eukprot:scaffold198171_cov47-Attheya_sp.AAC.1
MSGRRCSFGDGVCVCWVVWCCKTNGVFVSPFCWLFVLLLCGNNRNDKALFVCVAVAVAVADAEGVDL